MEKTHEIAEVDDQTILNTDHLLRRLPNWPNMTKFDHNKGQLRPSSAAFGDQESGDVRVSTTHQESLLASGGDIKDAIRHHPKFGLAQLNVSYARSSLSTPQIVVRDPTSDDDHHCLLVGRKTDGDKRKLAKNCVILIEPTID
jgi:hypothetical protein